MWADGTLQGQVQADLQNGQTGESKPWVDSLLGAYQYFQTQKNITAADKLYQAAELMPVKNWEVYMVAATLYGAFGELDKGFLSIDRAVDSGMNDFKLLTSLPDLMPFRKDTRWENVLEKAKRIEEAANSKIQKPELLEELKAMWQSDQAALANFNEQVNKPGQELSAEAHRALFKEVEHTWDENRTRLEEIISEYGWPGYKLVGKEGEKLSWAIPQHHPDVFFKKQCLALIKRSVEKGDANPNHYAELHDRIARDIWTKQKFGASMGQGKPYPIANPAAVNQRREQLGLADPVEIYAMYHRVAYRAPSQKQAAEDSIRSFNMAQEKYALFLEQISDNSSVAVNNLKEAIRHYGDLSNQQLFKASQVLVATNQADAVDLSLRILKVLVWREWEGSNSILSSHSFDALFTKEDWSELKAMILDR